MHKLAKGLKKKKKKKDKKGAEDEDFDPEELERYRRERAEAQQQQTQSEASGDSSAVSGSDEWKKFEALTAGVDSILKKTQGDLDRIKSTSFFQRKPVESEKKRASEADSTQRAKQPNKWQNFDKDGNPTQNTNDDEDFVDQSENKKKSSLITEEGFVNVPDDDEDLQENSADEDIFDTTYIDVLQNIDVQLAYIPDSPTQEETDDDPFDTTNADKVLKTVDKKGRKLLSLGNVVEVLSGRVDHVSTCKIGRPRKQQQRNLNLLLDESEQCEQILDGSVQATEEPVEVPIKTLLDYDTDLPDVPVDLTKLPPVTLPKSVIPATTSDELINNSTEPATTQNPPLDISEFEVLKEKTILEEIPDLGDDEFDLTTELSDQVVLQEADDPFAEKEPENADFQDEIVEVNFEAKTNADGEDPFDTTFADNILPGKAELKFIEKELEELPVSEVSISLTDPAGLNRDYETGLLKSSSEDQNCNSLPSDTIATKKEDLLGGSTTDLSQLADEPIAPIEELTYVDPFDTSAIKELPPGKVELKFLEKELLGEKQNKVIESLEDDDFDPRKEESTNGSVSQPKSQVPQIEEHIDSESNSSTRKASRPEILDIAPTKCVDFTLPTPSNRPDLLTTSDEEKSIPLKPLTPYYSQKSIEESLPDISAEDTEQEEKEEIDPFDTNFVAKIAPGKTELKLIESELLATKEPKLTSNLNDNDFDPRSDQVNQSIVEAVNKKATSYIKKSFVSQRQESILDAQVDVAAKPLTPNIESKAIVEEEEISYVDPFDTSIATNILPGKAELKILEKELDQIEQQVPVLTNQIGLVPLAHSNIVEEDDDFDPRAGEPKVYKDFLCLDGQNLEDKVLTPLNEKVAFATEEDIDPFDTSFATLAPGKTELKLLESELVTE